MNSCIFNNIKNKNTIKTPIFDVSHFEQLLKLLNGCSVTQRIRRIKQPRGGYINPRMLSKNFLGEGIESLNPMENVHASLVGTAVDYMTRYMLGVKLEDAFVISIAGASKINKTKKATQLLKQIKGLDDKSITNAVKLCGFDVCYRAGIMMYKPIEHINPDKQTIENIRTMIERSLSFFDHYGPKVLDGFTFEGGYTEIVNSGDGDFTTKDTLWDFKVSKLPIKKEHTLQLLMYWRMGLHSIHPEFKSIKYLGIYNPRLNCVYQIAVNDISEKIIDEVECEIIGYNRENL